MKQRPLLRRGPFTGKVWLLTRYQVEEDRIEALEKYDVTAEYDALREEEDR